jgi:hypothetical protein
MWAKGNRKKLLFFSSAISNLLLSDTRPTEIRLIA